MLKSIITQVWNRRRSNVSIFIELTLVFFLVWNMTDYLFVFACNNSLPNHRDLRHTWKVNLTMFPFDHPAYRAEADEPETLSANYRRILQALHNHPGIEAVGVCHNSASPGSGSFWGTTFCWPGDTARILNGQRIGVYPSEDFFRVFGYTRNEGREAVSMADFDWSNPRTIVISRSVANELFPGGEATGKELQPSYPPNYPPDARYIVGGVVDDIKRFDYLRPQHAYYLPMPLDGPDDIRSASISIRSRASIPDSRFREDFLQEMSSVLRIGNFHLQSLVPYHKIQADTARRFGMSGDLRMRLALIIFFLLNILLCAMGTFWYRVNLRRNELGLRKAMGASRAGISSALFLEGLCLLAFAALLAMVIEFQFAHAGLIETMGKHEYNTKAVYLPDRTLLRFLITNALTACILAAVILIAVWLPARRASSLPPAEAMRS
jgi:hypothetical protein